MKSGLQPVQQMAIDRDVWRLFIQAHGRDCDAAATVNSIVDSTLETAAEVARAHSQAAADAIQALKAK